MNGNTPCWCIPIKDCIKMKDLIDLHNQELIKNVKKQQKRWYENEIRNRDYTYKNKPEWMI